MNVHMQIHMRFLKSTIAPIATCTWQLPEFRWSTHCFGPTTTHSTELSRNSCHFSPKTFWDGHAMSCDQNLSSDGDLGCNFPNLHLTEMTFSEEIQRVLDVYFSDTAICSSRAAGAFIASHLVPVNKSGIRKRQIRSANLATAVLLSARKMVQAAAKPASPPQVHDYKRKSKQRGRSATSSRRPAAAVPAFDPTAVKSNAAEPMIPTSTTASTANRGCFHDKFSAALVDIAQGHSTEQTVQNRTGRGWDVSKVCDYIVCIYLSNSSTTAAQVIQFSVLQSNSSRSIAWLHFGFYP